MPTAQQVVLSLVHLDTLLLKIYTITVGSENMDLKQTAYSVNTCVQTSPMLGSISKATGTVYLAQNFMGGFGTYGFNDPGQISCFIISSDIFKYAIPLLDSSQTLLVSMVTNYTVSVMAWNTYFTESSVPLILKLEPDPLNLMSPEPTVFTSTQAVIQKSTITSIVAANGTQSIFSSNQPFDQSWKIDELFVISPANSGEKLVFTLQQGTASAFSINGPYIVFAARSAISGQFTVYVTATGAYTGNVGFGRFSIIVYKKPSFKLNPPAQWEIKESKVLTYTLKLPEITGTSGSYYLVQANPQCQGTYPTFQYVQSGNQLLLNTQNGLNTYQLCLQGSIDLIIIDVSYPDQAQSETYNIKFQISRSEDYNCSMDPSPNLLICGNYADQIIQTAITIPENQLYHNLIVAGRVSDFCLKQANQMSDGKSYPLLAALDTVAKLSFLGQIKGLPDHQIFALSVSPSEQILAAFSSAAGDSSYSIIFTIDIILSKPPFSITSYKKVKRVQLNAIEDLTRSFLQVLDDRFVYAILQDNTLAQSFLFKENIDSKGDYSQQKVFVLDYQLALSIKVLQNNPNVTYAMFSSQIVAYQKYSLAKIFDGKEGLELDFASHLSSYLNGYDIFMPESRPSLCVKAISKAASLVVASYQINTQDQQLPNLFIINALWFDDSSPSTRAQPYKEVQLGNRWEGPPTNMLDSCLSADHQLALLLIQLDISIAWVQVISIEDGAAVLPKLFKIDLSPSFDFLNLPVFGRLSQKDFSFQLSFNHNKLYGTGFNVKGEFYAAMTFVLMNSEATESCTPIVYQHQQVISTAANYGSELSVFSLQITRNSSFLFQEYTDQVDSPALAWEQVDGKYEIPVDGIRFDDGQMLLTQHVVEDGSCSKPEIRFNQPFPTTQYKLKYFKDQGYLIGIPQIEPWWDIGFKSCLQAQQSFAVSNYRLYYILNGYETQITTSSTIFKFSEAEMRLQVLGLPTDIVYQLRFKATAINLVTLEVLEADPVVTFTVEFSTDPNGLQLNSGSRGAPYFIRPPADWVVFASYQGLQEYTAPQIIDESDSTGASMGITAILEQQNGFEYKAISGSLTLSITALQTPLNPNSRVEVKMISNEHSSLNIFPFQISYIKVVQANQITLGPYSKPVCFVEPLPKLFYCEDNAEFKITAFDLSPSYLVAGGSAYSSCMNSKDPNTLVPVFMAMEPDTYAAVDANSVKYLKIVGVSGMAIVEISIQKTLEQETLMGTLLAPVDSPSTYPMLLLIDLTDGSIAFKSKVASTSIPKRQGFSHQLVIDWRGKGLIAFDDDRDVILGPIVAMGLFDVKQDTSQSLGRLISKSRGQILFLAEGNQQAKDTLKSYFYCGIAQEQTVRVFLFADHYDNQGLPQERLTIEPFSMEIPPAFGTAEKATLSLRGSDVYLMVQFLNIINTERVIYLAHWNDDGISSGQTPTVQQRALLLQSTSFRVEAIEQTNQGSLLMLFSESDPSQNSKFWCMTSEGSLADNQLAFSQVTRLQKPTQLMNYMPKFFVSLDSFKVLSNFEFTGLEITGDGSRQTRYIKSHGGGLINLSGPSVFANQDFMETIPEIIGLEKNSQYQIISGISDYFEFQSEQLGLSTAVLLQMSEVVEIAESGWDIDTTCANYCPSRNYESQGSKNLNADFSSHIYILQLPEFEFAECELKKGALLYLYEFEPNSGLSYNPQTKTIDFTNARRGSVLISQITSIQQVQYTRSLVMTIFGNKGPPFLLDKDTVFRYTYEEGSSSTMRVSLAASDPDLDDAEKISYELDTQFPDVFQITPAPQSLVIKVDPSLRPDEYKAQVKLADNYDKYNLTTIYEFTLEITALPSGYIPPIFMKINQLIKQGANLTGVENPLTTRNIAGQLSSPVYSNTDNVTRPVNFTDYDFERLVEQMNSVQSDVIPQLPVLLDYLKAIQILSSSVRDDEGAIHFPEIPQNASRFTQMIVWFNTSSDSYMTFMVRDVAVALKLVRLLQRGRQVRNFTVGMLPIRRVTQAGEVTVNFDFKSTTLMAMVEKQLDLTLQKQVERQIPYEAVGYAVSFQDESVLKLGLAFADQTQVSVGQEKDLLTVRMSRQLTLIEDGYTLIIPKSTKQTVDVPPQLSQQTLEIVERFSQGVSIATIILIPGNTILNIFISGAMSQLYGLLNCLSILTILNVIPVNIPGPARLISGTIVQFSQFDMIPTQQLIASLGFKFSQESQEPLSSELEGLGFGQTSTLGNLGSSTVYLTLNIYSMLIVPLVHVAVPKSLTRLKKLTQRVFDFTIWGLPVRFLLSQYLTLFLSSLIKVTAEEIQDPKNGDIFDYYLAHSILALSAIAPSLFIMILIFAYKNIPRLRARLGPLFQDIDTQSLMKSLAIPLQLLKLQLTIAILIFVRDYPSLIIISLLQLSIGYQAYLIYFRPYSDFSDNLLQTFNEGLVAVYLYTLMTLTDFQPEPSFKEFSSWALIANYGVCFTVNFGKMAHFIWNELAKKLSKRSIRRQRVYENIVKKTPYQRVKKQVVEKPHQSVDGSQVGLTSQNLNQSCVELDPSLGHISFQSGANQYLAYKRVKKANVN